MADNPSKVNLLEFLKAFIKDNNAWLSYSKTNLTITQSKFRINGSDDAKVREFITVIAGSKTLTGGFSVDPANILIYITNERLGEINQVQKNTQNNTLLIAWLNAVLQDNGITPLSAGDQKSIVDTQGQIILFYDSDSVAAEIKKYTATTADIVGGAPLTDTFLEKIESRLQLQDDVFSFRFRGSLVEDLSIEKIETPTLQKIMATQNLALSIEGQENDMTKGQENTQQQIEEVYRTGNNAVTYKDKKRALTILYASMTGATIKSIGHPWVRIGKPIGIKGTGFFDGKYLVTKVKHTIDNTNKFTTEINACRMLNQADKRSRADDALKASDIAQNSGDINKAEAVQEIQQQNKFLNNMQKPIVDNVTNQKDLYAVSTIRQNAERQQIADNYYSPLNELHQKHRQKFIDFVKDVNKNTQYQVVEFTKTYVTPGLSAPNLNLHNYGLAITIILEHRTTKTRVTANQSNLYWGTTGVLQIAANHGLSWGGAIALTYPGTPTNYFGMDLQIVDGIKYTKETLLSIAKKDLGYPTTKNLTKDDYNRLVGNKLSI